MINTQYLPPHPKAVEDLFSLLYIIANPDTVAKHTKGLVEAANKYTDASKGFVDKEADLAKREAELEHSKSKAAHWLSVLEGREKEVSRQEKDSAEKADKAYKLLADAESRAKAVDEAVQKLAHDKTNFEQNRLASLANLAEWESNLKKDIDAHGSKVKALKDLIHV